MGHQDVTVVDSLPDRPLYRSEVETIKSTESIGSAYPVFSDLAPNTAFGIDIAAHGNAHALAYSAESESWERLDDEELEYSTEGRAHVEEWDKIQRLQDVASKFVSE